VKDRSRIFVVYNGECILVAHEPTQNIIARPKNRWKSAVTQSHSINELNLRINSKCAAPRHAFIEHAVGHLRLHLRACVRAECGHASEHAVMKIM